MLSKLCKENQPEACNDCLSIRCKCTCHKRDYTEENICQKLENQESLDD